MNVGDARVGSRVGVGGSERAELPDQITAALSRGATVVTANQRAARTLRQAYDRVNHAEGLASWEPARVLSWDAWTSGMWRSLVIGGQTREMLLNQSQELAVWSAVLKGDRDLESLQARDSVAGMAANAWDLLCSYRGQSRVRELAVSTDTRAFQRWAQTFERRCRADGFLAQAGLEEALREAVVLQALEDVRGEIVLVGFDSLTPAQLGLIEALREAGGSVSQLEAGPMHGEGLLVEATEEAEELRACARWLRTFLEEHPGARVGVIVPGLSAQRTEIERVFRQVLAQELEDIGAGTGLEPFEFSVGTPLARLPMVSVAIDLLRWVQGPLPLDRVSALLLSPYFGGGRKSLGARAEFDAFGLRRAAMLRPEISIEALIALTDKSGKTGLDELRAGLRRMKQVATRRIGKADSASYAEWAEAMRDLLEAGGWGTSAAEAEDSVEYQTRTKWESALDEMATLDFDGARVGFRAALDALDGITGRTMFAPESREAPVQIMGPLESAGSEFDAVWFLRAGELTWPVSAVSSPLLPWQIQRELAMPGTDAGLEMEFAQRVTERIARSAKTVIFSYAVTSSEGWQRPSKILHELALRKTTAAEFVPADEARVRVELEEVEDAARVAALPDGILQGGAKILELQAACGFRAFAEHRLWSTELDEVELGMDARESGSVVHRVLEQFWGQVQTQAALLAMSEAERGAALDDAIGRGLAKLAALGTSEWDSAYMGMQRERLRRLLGPWLGEEMARPEFVVKELEKNLPDVRIGPLRLSVRVDRVDETEGGDVLIDYKTGRAATKDWLTERPDAPQLPLYAVVAETERLGGVAFGVVRAGKEMSWKSFAASEEVMHRPGKMEGVSFEDQVDAWRAYLTALAEQFAAGDARVRPKNFPRTCEHCGQRLVCRVEAALLEEGDEDEEAEVNGG